MPEPYTAREGGGYKPEDAVPCACGAVTLPYVSARFVDNNVAHASDECQDFGSPDAFDTPPKAVTVTYTTDPGGWTRRHDTDAKSAGATEDA